ncbi:MAG: hypothetical protein IPK58_07830 [Acidobacteria bacterium]|nr:hypothetical protein [Acidobacteriota bacterium]
MRFAICDLRFQNSRYSRIPDIPEFQIFQNSRYSRIPDIPESRFGSFEKPI